MSPFAPRGQYERRDVLLPAKIWRTMDREDPTVAATCRNISGRGCRLTVEDAKLVPGFDVESPIQFTITLDSKTPDVLGGGLVCWIKRERGIEGKTRLVLGVEFTAVPLDERERIKAFIFRQPDSGLKR